MGPVQHSVHVWHKAFVRGRCRHERARSLPLSLHMLLFPPPRIPAVLQIDWFTAGRQLSGPMCRWAVNCSQLLGTETEVLLLPWSKNTSELRQLSFPHTRECGKKKLKTLADGRPRCSYVPVLPVLRSIWTRCNRSFDYISSFWNLKFYRFYINLMA